MTKSNQVTLIGLFGQDPKKTITQDGKIIGSFSFATHDSRKNQVGEYVQHTEWHNVVAFGKTAELICTHMKKGSHAAIFGKLQTRQYVDKTEQNRYTTEIIVSDILFLNSGVKKDSANDQE